MPLHRFPPRLWASMRLRDGICARLPQHYLASLQDNTPPTPVHWEPHGLRYRRNPRTGERERVQDVPVPVYFPPAANEGLWGGEGWVRGFRYARDDKLSTRLPKTWKPQLFKRQFYSEILDATLTITVTMRTLDLIDAAFGFDFYILKVPADMCSKLGMDLKRTMLLRWHGATPRCTRGTPARRDAVYDKYKVVLEEAEWVGLSLEEDPVPLFKVYAEELVSQLKEQQQAVPEAVEEETLGAKPLLQSKQWGSAA
uniref:Large ribosomal subunit protein bL28m n=1 Tax=Taeniopygia guttata TaxID=59729 RepID=A0A674GYP8_TAEGU